MGRGRRLPLLENEIMSVPEFKLDDLLEESNNEDPPQVAEEPLPKETATHASPRRGLAMSPQVARIAAIFSSKP